MDTQWKHCSNHTCDNEYSTKNRPIWWRQMCVIVAVPSRIPFLGISKITKTLHSLLRRFESIPFHRITKYILYYICIRIFAYNTTMYAASIQQLNANNNIIIFYLHIKSLYVDVGWSVGCWSVGWICRASNNFWQMTAGKQATTWTKRTWSPTATTAF